MKKLLIIALVIYGFYQYLKWQPSTSSIVKEMSFSEQLSFNGVVYYSDWVNELESITGYVRRIDRHYDENIPIITFDLVMTSGDFSDPNLVRVKHRGGGNYFWSSDKQAKGSIIFYHTVPNSALAQSKLDSLKAGASVTILAKVSGNNEIKASNGAFFELVHSNHKIIRVEDIK